MTDSSTTLRTGPGPVRQAAFRLDRYCGLSAGTLSLSEPVRRRLAGHAEAEADLVAAATSLGDAIFPLVPSADQGARRQLLKIRRTTHRGGRLSPEDVAFLDGAGVPGAATEAWLGAREELSRRAAGLQEAVSGCAAETAATLRAHLDSGPLGLSFPLIAPHLPADPADRDLAPGGRTSRTVLGYLVQATLKPSPRGRLTTVALHPATDQAPSERSGTTVAIGFVHSLFAELAATPRFAEGFRYAPAYPVPSGEGAASVVLGSLTDTSGFLWSTERIVDARLYRAELDEAGARPPAALAPGRLARYVRTGMLVPVVPWEAGSRTPLLDLAAALLDSTAEDAVELAGTLTALDGDVRAVATADPAERRRILAGIRTRADQLSDHCGAPRWTAQLVHEDGAGADLVGPLPTAVDTDLRTVAATLRPHLVRSHIYDAVLQAFRDRHGVGGRCPDAAAFFLRLQADSTFRSAFRRARTRDLAADPAERAERAGLPVGRTSAPPSAAVLYQLAAEDSGAAHRGDYRMVVNQYGSALGGLVTRFGGVLGEEAVANAQLGWLRALFPGCDVRAFTVSGHVNNLQHAGAGHLPEIHWPAERQQRTADSIGFEQLVLRHDATTDTLEFEDSSGRPVAPVYTGIVPAQLATGAARLALAVLDPWIDVSPLTRNNHPFLRAQALTAHGSEVVRTPRTSVGRVVVQRARWVLPASSFPVPERDESTTAHLLRLDRWRRDRQLPHEVFFLALGSDPLDASRRKPMWLDFASPHSVAAALRLIAGAHTLRIEEALPGRDEVWVAGPDGPRSCEHISFLAWDRPHGDHR
ncbi:lantibiotic dehydratase [Kitasatospora sp. SUK 42]|uniref:lantibiotic dehydratase n=1 Tax=Kitasatospora sp. SUK 42 TaxID=1588882 RepID=UPI0018C908CB|nr:lantibiotic dehydratase [Kitasatospora sp. SUK 42]MBV2153702.1 lantibiotic dehydratase family protein [Kitasatospora sp. SUK 42]